MNPAQVVVSVVIPCYNHGAYIQEAISSVEQNVGKIPYEIIVVDDGSTDQQTLFVIEELIAKGYNVIRQQNQGLAAARNNAIAVAKGRYILPLDSDNKLDESYFTKGISLLDNNESIDVVYGNALFFGATDGIRNAGINTVGEFDIARILDFNYIDACAIYRKSIWEKVGGYDGKMPAMGHEDWEIWINMYFSGGKLYFLNELCFHYRIVAGSMIATNAAQKHESNKEYIYVKHATRAIPYLLGETKKLNILTKYIENYRIRAIAKLLLGRKM
jgi:glycosyltransferase involved in cell wall biosynthesis